MSDRPLAGLHPEIFAYYDDGREQGRLLGGAGRLEYARTQRILQRVLPPPPAQVLDVGGGPGAYAHWLTSLGYGVTLVDPVPRHIEQARAASNGYAAAIGDARALAAGDTTADAVLLLGPLYHLTERHDRLRALAEARRVLRPSGSLVCAAISRFASLLDGLRGNFLDDPAFAALVDDDLQDGRHANPDRHPGWFTTAYLHRPDELAAEVTEAGFALDALLAVEGPCWLLPEFEARWQNEQRREQMLAALARIEREPSLLGVSAHFLAVARNS